jgi:hypothetical protein
MNQHPEHDPTNDADKVPDSVEITVGRASPSIKTTCLCNAQGRLLTAL